MVVINIIIVVFIIMVVNIIMFIITLLTHCVRLNGHLAVVETPPCSGHLWLTPLEKTFS